MNESKTLITKEIKVSSRDVTTTIANMVANNSFSLYYKGSDESSFHITVGLSGNIRIGVASNKLVRPDVPCTESILWLSPEVASKLLEALILWDYCLVQKEAERGSVPGVL